MPDCSLLLAMMDCKCQVGFKVSLFVSHLLALFCPVFFKGWIYFTISVKSTASSNYNIVIVLGLTSAAKRQKTQQTKGGNEQRLVKGSLQKESHPQVLLNGCCPMNGGKSCKGESRNKRKCKNTAQPLHSLLDAVAFTFSLPTMKVKHRRMYKLCKPM